MRVIAGTARHLTLQTPKGDKVRPTTDRIKETLFNMIQGRIADARFLDLFAGSGGIGIEALSRGAVFCAFSDRDQQALACIRANLTHTKLEERAQVLAGDYSRNLARLRGGEAFDIIFMDPPYGSGLEAKALQSIAEYGLLHDDGIIIAETGTETDLTEDLPQGWRISRIKTYKTNQHVFIERGEQP